MVSMGCMPVSILVSLKKYIFFLLYLKLFWNFAPVWDWTCPVHTLILNVQLPATTAEFIRGPQVQSADIHCSSPNHVVLLAASLHSTDNSLQRAESEEDLSYAAFTCRPQVPDWPARVASERWNADPNQLNPSLAWATLLPSHYWSTWSQLVLAQAGFNQRLWGLSLHHSDHSVVP